MSRTDDLATLGLNLGASDNQIRAAYRAQALSHHPDLGGDAKVMVEISDAYQRLVDGGPTLAPASSTGQRSSVPEEAPDDFTIGHSMLAFVVVPMILVVILMFGVFSVLSTIL